MITARPIYHGRDLMLNANRSITADMITSLKRNDFSGIYVYDEFSDIEKLGELIDEGLRRDCLQALEHFWIILWSILWGARSDSLTEG